MSNEPQTESRAGVVSTARLGVIHDSEGLVMRLRAMADDDKYAIDDWSEDVLRQSASALEESERMRNHHAACCRDYLARNQQLERELETLLAGTNDRLTWQYWRDRARQAEGNYHLPNDEAHPAERTAPHTRRDV